MDERNSATRRAAWPVLWSVIAAIASAPSAPAQAADYEAVEAKYKAMLGRPSLNRRIEGRRLLAETGDPRAFTLLAKDYAKPAESPELLRSLIVTNLAEFWPDGPSPCEAWRTFRTNHPEAVHAWLWYRSLCIEGEEDPAVWRPIAAGSGPIEMRAVALAAGSAKDKGAVLDAETLGVLMDIAVALPSRSSDRSVLLEGAVAVFESPSEKLQPQQRAVLRTLIHAMQESSTSPRTRLVLARSLAKALGRDNIGPDAANWIDLLADKSEHEIESAYALKRAAARPSFFGIVDHSLSIAYVIDASDSMLEPLTPRERADLQPLTGDGAKERASDGQAELSIDWSLVKTRFDGARELLKKAVRALRPDQEFTVILFGDKAEHLVATPKLVKASKKAIDAVCAELDAIRPGPAKQERPHGTLRGGTNVHGGLVRAFRVGEKPVPAGKKGPAAKPDVRLDEDGVDTIFLLSDGEPSTDDYRGNDTNDGTTVGDPETGKTAEHTGGVVYPGPFAWPPYLLADIRRLNLLQRASIHTIGLGEANYEFLERLSKSAHGRTVQIGRK